MVWLMVVVQMMVASMVVDEIGWVNWCLYLDDDDKDIYKATVCIINIKLMHKNWLDNNIVIKLLTGINASYFTLKRMKRMFSFSLAYI